MCHYQDSEYVLRWEFTITMLQKIVTIKATTLSRFSPRSSVMQNTINFANTAKKNWFVGSRSSLVVFGCKKTTIVRAWYDMMTVGLLEEKRSFLVDCKL